MSHILSLFLSAAQLLLSPELEPPGCSMLFVSDTHGPAAENAALVEAMVAEEGVHAVLHGGDVADAADLYAPWFDVPFRPVEERWNVWAASGNHDAADAETRAAFGSRFSGLPTRFPCGAYAEIYILPWAPTAADIAWFTDAVEGSAAHSHWRVLVIHRAPWPVGGGNARLRDALLPALAHIDLVLSGHDHVSSDSVHDVDGHPVRQIIEVSGPKKYQCPARADGCIEDETAYWRIGFYENEIRTSRRVVR